MTSSVVKSETMWTALAVGALGAAIEGLPMISENLGDYYGMVFVGLGVLMAVLRIRTTKPVQDL